jgi:hypothetical protein
MLRDGLAGTLPAQTTVVAWERKEKRLLPPGQESFRFQLARTKLRRI